MRPMQSQPNALPQSSSHSAYLAERLTTILTEPVYPFTAVEEREIVRNVTEKRCFLGLLFHCRAEGDGFRGHRKTRCSGLNYDTELKSNVEIDKEKTHFAKVLVQPKFTGKGPSEIHGMSFQMKCDVDICMDLYANVVLSGGPVSA